MYWYLICILINKLGWRSECKAKSLETREWWHTPGLRKQGQTDFCEFKATLGYTISIQKQIQVVVAPTFNPSVCE